MFLWLKFMIVIHAGKKDVKNLVSSQIKTQNVSGLIII